jgi:ABC-type sugar transport system ATPase subunit
MENNVILQMKDITKTFPGVMALNSASFEINRGEVHALIGENGAGKSTLMKILLGIYQSDHGSVLLNGQPVFFKSPNEALTHGISMIHQEISLVQSLSVDENVWLGHEKQFFKGGVLDSRARRKSTVELLREMELDLDPDALVKTLSVAKMQLVELVRAVSCNADIIIMDEPTSALTDKEIEILYDNVRRLSAKGVSIIFISHKLEEIFEICKRVTVMRDGATIGVRYCSDLKYDELITMIVGREMTDLYPKEAAEIKGTVLEVKDLTSAGVFENVSFELHEREILGFSGLVGSGRTEIMNAIFGIDRYDSGSVLIDGQSVLIKSPSQAIENGIGMITEDRLRMGSIHKLSVMANISIVKLREFCNRAGICNTKNEESLAQKLVEQLSIHISDLKQQMGELSGGNQQKAIIGRWLAITPRILILDEPTRGIDVGAKAEIHRLISQLAKSGMAIIIVSSEMPEIIGMCDRILVMREGRLVYECRREEASQEVLIKYAFGV